RLPPDDPRVASRFRRTLLVAQEANLIVVATRTVALALNHLLDAERQILLECLAVARQRHILSALTLFKQCQVGVARQGALHRHPAAVHGARRRPTVFGLPSQTTDQGLQLPDGLLTVRCTLRQHLLQGCALGVLCATLEAVFA